MKVSRFFIKGVLYNISCVAYEPENKKAEFSIVCLHGFGGDKESSAINLLAHRITDNGGAVVAFDFASHGESETSDEMLTVENCVNDTKTIYAYAKNRYGKADFFATSFGAYILVNLLKSVDFKGVRAVLRSPAVKMENTFLDPICNLASAELKRKGNVECGFERTMKLGYSFWEDLKKHSVFDAEFDNDTLMIYGDRDDVVSPVDMEVFAAKRSNIKAKVIKGADHRFKGKGQLKEAIESAAEFLLL
ncbi:MAG: alpha/beta hydrolase [Clostridia bacterium]|nr:alpha/beta hydrolase [Clostridia bacterium]